MNTDSDRQHAVAPKKRGDSWLAFGFAFIANLVFLALIVFSVSWRNPPATPVTAEIYAPPPPVVEPLPEPPKIPPAPEPPKVTPPKVEPPKEVLPDPDIALLEEKKKAEEKARQEKLEKERIEKEQREAREKAERIERERKAREEKARKEKEERERKAREEKARQEAEAQKAAEAEKKFQQYLENQARENALVRWQAQIQAKVRGNVNLPPNIAGNPQALFEVTQLPTGEVLNARLVKSSGNAAYDEAVYRAILKSSPLPLPERKDLFQRQFNLRFQPYEN